MARQGLVPVSPSAMSLCRLSVMALAETTRFPSRPQFGVRVEAARDLWSIGRAIVSGHVAAASGDQVESFDDLIELRGEFIGRACLSAPACLLDERGGDGRRDHGQEAVATVAFSVDPSHRPSGILAPSVVIT